MDFWWKTASWKYLVPWMLKSPLPSVLNDMKCYWFSLFFAAFKNHCEFDHMATMQNAPCIWCGATFAQLELLRFHYHKCSQKMALSEANWTLCGFCPTIFFFTELTKSAFFIGHMNNYHRQNVDFSWGSQVSFKI